LPKIKLFFSCSNYSNEVIPFNSSSTSARDLLAKFLFLSVKTNPSTGSSSSSFSISSSPSSESTFLLKPSSAFSEFFLASNTASIIYIY